MSWEIRVWHEEVGERIRLSIEAGPQIPDDVISAVAGSYWFEEVQYVEEEWPESFEDEENEPRYQG